MKLTQLNEGWLEDLGITNPYDDKPLNMDQFGTEWLITYSAHNFPSKEQAIKYALDCYNTDLSDERQHSFNHNGSQITVELQHNPNDPGFYDK